MKQFTDNEEFGFNVSHSDDVSLHFTCRRCPFIGAPASNEWDMPSLYLSLKMMVSPRNSVTASKLNSGSHLLGASGFGFLFLGLGLGPEIDIYNSMNRLSSCNYCTLQFLTKVSICPP